MENDEKPTFDDYGNWLKKEFSVEVGDKHKRQYDSATVQIMNKFKHSEFWRQLRLELKTFNESYQIQKGYTLFQFPLEPTISIKPFDSFYHKTYRKNILENLNWDNAPTEGWILPKNWFSKINDILRTKFIVKYLDGVEFLLSSFSNLCNDFNLKHKEDLKAKREGYYAAHMYILNEFEIPDLDFGSKNIELSIEFQITTQLQDVIQNLTHKYYEQRRKRINDENIIWQWDYKSEEFAANYLGHILHYVEGMIMEIRRKQEKEADI